MSAHDRWLANYHSSSETAYCQTRGCSNAEDGMTVWYESEYGQGWFSPESCPLCDGELSFDQLPEEDEDDEDAPTEPQEASSGPSTPNPTL